MIKGQIIEPKSGKAVSIRSGLDGLPALIIESAGLLDSRWKQGLNDAIETIDIVTPTVDGSIFVTDIIMTSPKKVAGLDIIIRFSDGTNTENLLEIEGATAAVNFSHSFRFGIFGWKDAILQVNTDVAACNVRTLICYVKIPPERTLDYAAWGALR